MTNFYVDYNNKVQWHSGTEGQLASCASCLKNYLISYLINTKMPISSREFTAVYGTMTNCTWVAKVKCMYMGS